MAKVNEFLNLLDGKARRPATSHAAHHDVGGGLVISDLRVIPPSREGIACRSPPGTRFIHGLLTCELMRSMICEESSRPALFSGMIRDQSDGPDVDISRLRP